MNLIRKTACCVIASLLLTAADTAAATDQAPAKVSQTDKKTTTLNSETAPAQKGPIAHFSETSHKFEPVVEGFKVSHDFILQNKGTVPLHIKKVKTG